MYHLKWRFFRIQCTKNYCNRFIFHFELFLKSQGVVAFLKHGVDVTVSWCSVHFVCLPVLVSRWTWVRRWRTRWPPKTTQSWWRWRKLVRRRWICSASSLRSSWWISSIRTKSVLLSSTFLFIPMALNSLLCAHVPLRNCSLTHSLYTSCYCLLQSVVVALSHTHSYFRQWTQVDGCCIGCLSA